MKTQIRQGVFETNSSSTHSLTMCTESDFERWKNGELIFYGSFAYGGELTTLSEAKKNIYFYESDVHTYKDWEDYYGGLETYEQKFTTPSGETIIGFGAYGYDG